jgi:hypothetical protein
MGWFVLVSDSSGGNPDITVATLTINAVYSRDTPLGPADLPANQQVYTRAYTIPTGSRVISLPIYVNQTALKNMVVAVSNLAPYGHPSIQLTFRATTGSGGKFRAYFNYYSDASTN